MNLDVKVFQEAELLLVEDYQRPRLYIQIILVTLDIMVVRRDCQQRNRLPMGDYQRLRHYIQIILDIRVVRRDCQQRSLYLSCKIGLRPNLRTVLVSLPRPFPIHRCRLLDHQKARNHPRLHRTDRAGRLQNGTRIHRQYRNSRRLLGVNLLLLLTVMLELT